jgi:tetratricopeptide (TPR) repeat protein
MAEVPLVRLDAFENYVRGVLARGRQEKVRYLKEALRLNPAYTQAMMELGKSYYNAEDYEQAANWFARIPKSNKLARQANFYLGIAAYQLGDNDRAESAFSFVASHYPLPEIYNNLAAIGVRRGSAAAVEQLQRAIQLDPQDADYRFNLALALYRTADYGGAARQLRESLKLRSRDAEAQALLDSLTAYTLSGTKAQGPAPAAKVPPPRLKTNYDESPFQQLALEIQNTNEVRLAKMDVPSHAAFHIDHGREMLKQGFAVEAERDFREASELDPSNPAAQAGLAEALEKTDSAGARSAAEAALRLGESVPALLVLARLDLRENHSESAMERVNRVLILDPQERSALALKQSMLAKQNTTQKLPTKGNAP